jgi:hypothetical protein
VNVAHHSPYGLRIGNTLELILTKGMWLKETKAKGRWSSEAFAGYLREHKVILAPLL